MYPQLLTELLTDAGVPSGTTPPVRPWAASREKGPQAALLLKDGPVVDDVGDAIQSCGAQPRSQRATPGRDA